MCFDPNSMPYYQNSMPQQGWVCPCCHRVYSPSTPMCLYCVPGRVVTQPNTLNPNTDFYIGNPIPTSNVIYCKTTVTGPLSNVEYKLGDNTDATST